jgi:hypothetical protein
VQISCTKVGKPKKNILQGVNLKGIFCRDKGKLTYFAWGKDLFTLKKIFHLCNNIIVIFTIIKPYTYFNFFHFMFITIELKWLTKITIFFYLVLGTYPCFRTGRAFGAFTIVGGFGSLGVDFFFSISFLNMYFHVFFLAKCNRS